MSIAESFNQDLAGRRILVVEDDPIVAQLIIGVLRELGSEVAGPVVNAAAVWESINDFPPDLVLMDIGIEGVQDGIDTAAMIREQFDVPVIFLTSASEPEVVERAKRVDPLGYLIKPIKPVALRSTVEVALWRIGMERRLRERECWFAATLKAVSDAVVTADERGSVTYLNPQAEQLLGRSFTAVEGSRLVDVVRLRDELSGAAIDVMSPAAKDERALLLPIDDRPAVAVEHALVNILDERNQRLGSVLTLRNVAERRRHEREVQRLNAELMNQAVIDELTGLSNRRGLLVLAEQQLRACARTHAPLTVLFADVNGMKSINERFGQEIGDQALRDTARILKATLRNSDIVCRLGGDEFVVVAATEQAERLQTRIVEAVDAHNRGAQHGYVLSLSIGSVVHWPDKTTESAEFTFARLLADADNAVTAQKPAFANSARA